MANLGLFPRQLEQGIGLAHINLRNQVGAIVSGG
ncbi:MAG: hypothetical protein RLY39_309, partial [Actinomycetota bacterium]